MEESNNHINIIPQVKNKITVRASEIIKKFRSFHDREAFCKENSKNKILNLRPLLSKGVRLRLDIFPAIFTRR